MSAANVFIGREPRRFGPLRLIDRKLLHARVAPLLKRLGCDFKPRHARRRPVAGAAADCWRSSRRCRSKRSVVIMDEPTSSVDADRDRQPPAGHHRRPQGERRRDHLHLASPERGRALRRPRRGAARRRSGGVARPRRDAPRQHDPIDDRPRPQDALYAAEGRRRRRRAGADRPGDGEQSRTQDDHARTAGRRDPRARRAGRGGPDGACARHLRRRAAGGRLAAHGRRADRH